MPGVRQLGAASLGQSASCAALAGHVGVGFDIPRLGGPWCALQRGGAVYLSEGDQVSVDCSDPEAAVFTCYLCSCQSNLCTCPASPRYQQGDAWACSKAVHPNPNLNP